MHIFRAGKLNDVDVIVVFSGCGKINAAITAQQLIDRYKVDTIIFSGIAGGMTEETNISDTVVCIASDFRDTNNEIYSDFPIVENSIFYLDKHLCGIAKKKRQRKRIGKSILDLPPQVIFLQTRSTRMHYV